MAYRILVFFVAPQRSDSRAPSETLSDAIRLVELLHLSACRHDRGVVTTILSDRETDLSSLAIDAEVIRYDLDTDNMMLSRTRAQCRFVAGYNFDRPLAILDFDILVNRSIDWLFERDFDIALTARRKRDMPINGGVILANNRAPDKVRRFFDQLLATYTRSYGHLAAWWGDQMALNDILSIDVDVGRTEKRTAVSGIDVLILPAAQYNFSPHLLSVTLSLPRSNKYILHFKSSGRKRFMAPFFALHMKPALVDRKGE